MINNLLWCNYLFKGFNKPFTMSCWAIVLIDLKVNSYIYIKNGNIIYLEADILFCLCNILTFTWEQKSEIYLGIFTARSKKFSTILGSLRTNANSRKCSQTTLFSNLCEKYARIILTSL